MWLYCALIIAVAVTGKIGGTSIAARVGGLSWQNSAQLGVLMNTRGLMELVILNIGLDLKVISPSLFSMMVIMALVTTFMTTPVLLWIRGGAQDERHVKNRISEVAL
jgi:Kef-type K+ transport system membrane component KefB